MVGVGIDGGSQSSVMNVGDFFYERKASSLANPVPANTQGHSLLYYEKTDTRPLRITSIGTDQHDNSQYLWYIDGVLIESISGAAAIGTIHSPYIFPRAIRVYQSIELKINNNNGKAYPNDTATATVDRIPYEAVVAGIWG